MAGKLVFHGTMEKVGTPCTVLRRPSLSNPFFVSESPDAAKWYARFRGGSVFILRLKDGWDRRLFDFGNDSDLQKLKSVGLSKTYGLIQKYTRGGSTFFDASVDIGEFIDCLSFCGTDQVRQAYMITQDEDGFILGSCVELGLLDENGEETQTLKKLLDSRI